MLIGTWTHSIRFRFGLLTRSVPAMYIILRVNVMISISYCNRGCRIPLPFSLMTILYCDQSSVHASRLHISEMPARKSCCSLQIFEALAVLHMFC